MTQSLYFTLGVHNHQPVGNFPEVFQYATESAYRPFIDRLYEHPGIPMTFHFTGILLRWIAEHHPSLIDRLRVLVERGQVEIQTGGFYEPILPMVPDRDKIGQIRKLTAYVQDLLGCTPTGMWLAERVWEPSLAKPIAEAGVKYIVIDDSHFKSVGFSDEQLYGYYVTEEQGVPLAIFPISEPMRYLVPFRLVEETEKYFRSVATEEGNRLVVLADDGEKFGVWPGTHQWVYKEGWLDKFFQMLETNRDWVKMVTFQDYLQAQRSLGPVYLPTASYSEMMQWALPAPRSRELERLMHEPGTEACRPFLKGGFWRVFLAKYIESNNLHKKMLRVGDRIARMPEAKQAEALDALWTGQCNCSYWHGVFGGLYLNHLRTAIYQNLLRAEKYADAALHKGKSWVEAEKTDFFRDGGQCLLVSTPCFNYYFNLFQGGALFELDDKAKEFNLLNTMTRREEAYHYKLLAPKTEASGGNQEGSKSIHDLVLTKEEGLEKRLHYDWYRRSGLIDHFFGPETTLEEQRTSVYPERGDFVNQPYEAEWSAPAKGPAQVRLFREGKVTSSNGPCPVRVEKEITIGAAGGPVPIRYTLTNRGNAVLPVRFGVEFGFSLQAGDTFDRYYIIPGQEERPRLGSVGEVRNLKKISLVEEWVGLKITLSMDRPADFWRFPIETISNSEGGFERVYQSSVVTIVQQTELQPGKPWSFELTLTVEHPEAGKF